jgi:hypothetical protein
MYYREHVVPGVLKHFWAQVAASNSAVTGGHVSPFAWQSFYLPGADSRPVFLNLPAINSEKIDVSIIESRQLVSDLLSSLLYPIIHQLLTTNEKEPAPWQLKLYL